MTTPDAAPTFGPDDDGFHFGVMSDRWWETETSWFSFHHPERRLGGWFYTMVRPNIGTVAGGAWVWDHTAHLPWDVLYSANYSALQLPEGADLRDVTLPTGVSIRAVEPTMGYELGFDDGDRFQASLRFDGVMPPEPLTAALDSLTRDQMHASDEALRTLGSMHASGGGSGASGGGGSHSQTSAASAALEARAESESRTAVSSTPGRLFRTRR